MSQVLYSIIEVIQFLIFIIIAIVAIEAFLYAHFKLYDKKWFPVTSILSVSLLGYATSFFFETSIVPHILTFITIEILLLLCFKFLIKGRHLIPYMLIAPAMIGLGILIVYPIIFECYLAFHDLKLTTLKIWVQTGNTPFVGLKHFKKVFTSSPLSEVTFWELILRTIWWTFINVFFHVIGGFIIAMLLNNKIRFRGVYRTLIIVPWATPVVVSILALRGEFHAQYGFINIMLEHIVELLPFLSKIGIGPVEWLAEHPLATCVIINVWLGIPFMMIIILGGLQSISSSFYDAASIDGASWIQKFRYVTLPLIRPVLGPVITLGAIWTFNNINVIFLITGQAGGSEEADILVTALYKSAFTYYRYSYSAAFAMVIFAMLFVFSVSWLKITKSTESIYD